MSLKRSSLIMTVAVGAILICGCAEETSQVKIKVAEIEKRLQKQEKDLKGLCWEVLPPSRFQCRYSKN